MSRPRPSRIRCVADHFRVIVADVTEIARAGAIPLFVVRGQPDAYLCLTANDSHPAVNRAYALRPDHTWLRISDPGKPHDGVAIVQALPPL